MANTVKVGMISLGCAKNQVDAEGMLFVLKNAGYELVSDPERADCVIVNTCGFIEDARKEAIESIFEMAELKKAGRIRALIVSGCMAERYRSEIAAEIPEADAFLGTGSYGDIAKAVEKALSGERPSYFAPPSGCFKPGGRILTTPPYTAYLKIAEGCDNRCSYCAIPMIRGSLASRPIDELADEAKRLADGGVSELCVTAQDTTRYGEDLYGKSALVPLLEKLCRTDGLKWVRLLYAHPDRVSDELLSFMAGEQRMVPYLDIPVQHASGRILKAMNRRGDSASLIGLFSHIRNTLPDAALRTTVITGFPGETKADFEELCLFVETVQFDRLGAFAYSKEEGTPAYSLSGQIGEKTKQRRREIVMELQRRISERRGKRMKGRTLTVLTEGYDRYVERYFGRSYADAPEVDGKVFFTSKRALSAGEYVPVTITGSLEYDLDGECAAQ